MDRQHVEQLFRQHYRRMYSVACSLLYDGQESEDVVSEVFAHLLESNTELLPASAEGYLMVAVRNSCMKRLRDKSKSERILRLYTDELHDGDDWLDDERRRKQLRQLGHTLLSPQELHLCTSSPCASSTARTTRPSAPRRAPAVSPCGNICRASSKC